MKHIRTELKKNGDWLIAYFPPLRLKEGVLTGMILLSVSIMMYLLFVGIIILVGTAIFSEKNYVLLIILEIIFCIALLGPTYCIYRATPLICGIKRSFNPYTGIFSTRCLFLTIKRRLQIQEYYTVLFRPTHKYGDWGAYIYLADSNDKKYLFITTGILGSVADVKKSAKEIVSELNALFPNISFNGVFAKKEWGNDIEEKV
jgi:hypothetical protein